ncbi:MAG: hypothetical protein ACE5I7_19810, partial [Candidatus Binatia bacterium]
MSDSEDCCRRHLPIDAQTMRQLYRPKPVALAGAVTLTYVALAASLSLALGTRSVLAYAMA